MNDDDDRYVGDDTLGRRLQKLLEQLRSTPPPPPVRADDPADAKVYRMRRERRVPSWLGHALTITIAVVTLVFAYGRAMERIDGMMAERNTILTQMGSMTQRSMDLGERLSYLEGALKECRK